ncbi:MAG: hypothetical protein R3322_15300 [Kiloniellales bacterium]|jgi:hypothetical protein|nr:hypothetical protein [Kiloniellales bacterium]
MPYVTRDPEGRITSLHAERDGDRQEPLAADHPELLSFVGAHVRVAEIRGELEASDLELIRVLEDLIAVLVNNGIIRLTDLPLAAQVKLSRRGRLRDRLGGIGDLAGDADEVLLP